MNTLDRKSLDKAAHCLAKSATKTAKRAKRYSRAIRGKRTYEDRLLDQWDRAQKAPQYISRELQKAKPAAQSLVKEINERKSSPAFIGALVAAAILGGLFAWFLNRKGKEKQAKLVEAKDAAKINHGDAAYEYDPLSAEEITKATGSETKDGKKTSSRKRSKTKASKEPKKPAHVANGA